MSEDLKGFVRPDSTKTVEETGLPADGVVIALLTISVPGSKTLKIPFTNMQQKLVLGRDERADISLDDKAVSRLHAIVSREREKFFIEDLHSKNGTILNGKFVRSGKPVRLAHGDEMRIGRITIFFESNLPTSELIAVSTPETSQLQLVPTGYRELDVQLGGGIPEGYTLVLLSPSCDERDLLLKRMISSAISSGRPTFYLSNDFARTMQFAREHPQDFYVFSRYVNKMPSDRSNLFGLPSFENLSELNISIANGIVGTRLEEKIRKFMVIEILSDVLLLHKGLTTRRWLSDFFAKRKAQGFTILAVFNPLMASETDVQAIIELFDGVLDIHEKDTKAGPARFIAIKRLFARRYASSELFLEKDKLF